MSEPGPGPGRRFWITVGEGAAILAVVISALSFWDSHRERAEAERKVVTQAQAEAAFVLTGGSHDGGRRLTLAPLKPTQAIQSQQFYFPLALRADPVTITASDPRIEIAWIAAAVDKALDAAHAGSNGEGALPVAILTVYVEDGEVREDRSLYRLGLSWRSRFLAGRKVTLTGLSLIQRALKGDPRTLVDRRWAADPHIAPAAG